MILFWLAKISKSATYSAVCTRTSVAYRSRTRLLSTSPYGKGKDSSTSEGPGYNSEGDPSGKKDSARSAHAQWYTDVVPAMIPIALLGSAVYIGLQLVQTKLATEKYLDEANSRIAQLEEEIRRLQSEQEARARALGSSGSPSKSKSGDGSDAKRSTSRWWWWSS
ncbi:hypothetical protein ACEPAI_6258 [Sanghuangporus weigelae]